MKKINSEVVDIGGNVVTQSPDKSLSDAINDAGEDGGVIITADETLEDDTDFDPENGQTIIGAGGVLSYNQDSGSIDILANDVTYVGLNMVSVGDAETVFVFRGTEVEIYGCRFENTEDEVAQPLGVRGTNVIVSGTRTITVGGVDSVRVEGGAENVNITGSLIDGRFNISGSSINVNTEANLIL